MDAINIGNAVGEKATLVSSVNNDAVGQVDLTPTEFSVNDLTNDLNNEQADQIVEQDQNYDEQYPPQDEQVYQEQVQEEKKRKKHRQKEIDALAVEKAQAEQERDQYKKLYLESQLMSNTKQYNDLEKETEYLANVMKAARAENNDDVYVEANKQYTQIEIQKRELGKQLQDGVEYYKSLEETEENEEDDEIAEARYQTLLSMSHKKELKSEEYKDWLEENPEYDPYSEDFEPSLAQNLTQLKSEFNRYLYANKQNHLIGSAEYYDALNTLIREQNQRLYGAQPSMQQDNNQQEYQQSYQTSQPAYTIPQTYSAPVQRNGSPYQQGYNRNQLPELTEFEKRIAEVCPITEPPRLGQNPRHLSAQDKYRVYQENKAKLFGGR